MLKWPTCPTQESTSHLIPPDFSYSNLGMIAPSETPVCSPDQHRELLRHVRFGRLFELMDWVDEGLPVLIPEAERPRNTASLIREAIKCGNHSMVRFLWEKCWQREWEMKSLVSTTIWEANAAAYEIAKYLLSHGVPLGNASAYSIFKSHDDELIHAALKLGLSVRAPDGFADALSATGHSKHLLRLFRELRHDYPDLEKEGLIALKEAVENGKLKAAALLTWAGVDPQFEFPEDPYNEAEYEAQEPYLTSALDSLTVDEKARDMLKALKVEITDDIWLRFFEQTGWLQPERLAEVYHWIRNPDAVLLSNPDRAAEVTTSMLRHLDSWGDEWKLKQRQAIQLKACEYFAHLGVPLLLTKEDYDLRSLRRSFGKVNDTEALTRLFWVIYERGDENQRARLHEVVRTPKMQSIIRQHDPFLLRDLGLGSKHSLSAKVTKRDRHWHIDTYKVACPFEKPSKSKVEEASRQSQYYHPPASPPESPRQGYWNKYSHFHR